MIDLRLLELFEEQDGRNDSSCIFSESSKAVADRVRIFVETEPWRFSFNINLILQIWPLVTHPDEYREYKSNSASCFDEVGTNLKLLSSKRFCFVEIFGIVFLFGLEFSKNWYAIKFLQDLRDRHLLMTEKRLNFYFIFSISIFILLTRRKATETLYIGQAVTPTCFRRCQDIAVRLKFFILVFQFYKDMTQI